MRSYAELAYINNKVLVCFGITRRYSRPDLKRRAAPWPESETHATMYQYTDFDQEFVRLRAQQFRDQLERWQQPGDVTDVPQARLGYSNGDQIRSSRYLSEGSYLRLKNVTLSYDLPARWFSKAGLRDVRVYATGTNLLTFTKYDGWDPEVTTDYLASNIIYGVDFYSAPQPKNIVFGLRLGF